MFAIKSFFVFFVIFATLANAMPAHHRRIKRGSSKSCTKTSSSTATAKPTKSQDLKASSPSSTKSSSTKSCKTTKGSQTSTSAGSKSTSSSSNSTTSSTPTTGSKLLAAVMPVAVKTGSDGWTTVDGVSGSVKLTLAALNPKKMLTAVKPTFGTFNSKTAMKVTYPSGSYRLGLASHEGGVSFYTPGMTKVDLTTAKEATLGYSVYFDKDFGWNKGGKLPGFYGGISDSVAVGCSGGRRDVDCFSARFMWRKDGEGELYTYLPDPSNKGYEANKKICTVKPQSDCNDQYGASIGRGAFDFKDGAWNQISERVLLNDPPTASNGELEVYLNGVSVIKVTGLRIRGTSAGKIYGVQVQSFFGGHTSDFASPKTQNSYFSDFSVAILQTL